MLRPFFPLINKYYIPYFIRENIDIDKYNCSYVHNIFDLRPILTKFRIPIVYTYHASAHREVEIDIEGGKYGVLEPLARVYLHRVKQLERNYLAEMRKIICKSNYMKGDLLSRYGDVVSESEVRVIPLCVDEETYSFSDNPAFFRDEIGLPREKTILFTVRRLVERMGLLNLVDAMSEVVKHRKDILLVIGGKGYLRDAIEQRINKLGLAKYVKLAGFIPEPQLPTYFKASNLYVLPTQDYEGFGLVTIEALASGTPVMATPVGANPEVLEGLSGPNVSEGVDPTSISNGILEALDYGVGKSTRRRCREYYMSRFSSRRVSKQLRDEFEEATVHEAGT